MMNPDEEADDLNEIGPKADAPNLPGSDFVDLNDVSPELPEAAEMDAEPDATTETDLDADSALAESADASMAVEPVEISNGDAPAPEPAVLSAEERALRQERIDHPMRFSPVTGERARPGHVYMPWKPPAESGPTPAASDETPPAQAAAPETSGRETNPNPTPHHDPPPAPNASAPRGEGNQAPPREDIGHPLPRVLVTVSLANAQMLFDDALKQASQHMAKQFRELAIGEIDWAAFKRNAEKRAADWSLRSRIG